MLPILVLNRHDSRLLRLRGAALVIGRVATAMSGLVMLMWLLVTVIVTMTMSRRTGALAIGRLWRHEVSDYSG